MGKRKTNEEFTKEIINLVGVEYEFLEEYVNNKTKIKCKHNECGNIWGIVPDSFLRGIRCPICSIKNSALKKTKTNERFVQEVFELVGEEYVFLEKYISDNTKIKCKHNKCGHIWEIVPSSFLQGRGCPQCKGKKISKTKTWTDNQFRQEVDKLVGDEYTFLGEYLNSKTKILCKHNICGHEYEVTPNHFFNGTRCPQCNKPDYNQNPELFIQKVQKLVGNEYTFLEKYISNQAKIKCKHNICGHEWDVQPNNFFNGTRCPECFGVKKKTNEEFVEQIYDLVGDEYIFLEDYINNTTKIMCKHNECGYEWKVVPSNFIRGTRCPRCIESKGEQTIREYLVDSKISFKDQYTYDDLTGIGGGLLRFDFAVFYKTGKLKFLIEYDGVFHYRDVFEDGSLKLQQVHDELKNQYCKDNNIPLLRIPYWEFDNIKDILNENLRDYNLKIA